MKSLVTFILWVALIVGYIRCVVKFIECDFNPIGKAEVVYGVGIVTGLGSIIGYLNIEDK